MWVLVTKNAAAKPLSHHFAALWEPIWGLCGFIGQSLEGSFSETHIHTLACLCGTGAYASELVQRASEKSSSREPGFRERPFSETRRARGHKERTGVLRGAGPFSPTFCVQN